MLADRTALIPVSKTSSTRQLARELSDRGVAVANFSRGELAVDTCSAIKTSAIDAITQGMNKYTDTVGIDPLRRLIAAGLEAQTRMSWTKEQVALTAGAKQALFNVVMVLVNPGDEVIIPAPYWTTFPAQVAIADGKSVFVDTRPRNYAIKASDIDAAITPRTRAIIVNTPNNPTGAVCGEKTLRALAELALAKGIWLILDECYSDFIYPPARHRNILALNPAVRERVVFINSFSKSLALTGWRLGYAAGPEPIIKAIRALQSHTTSNPNVIAQYAVLGGLQKGVANFRRDVLHQLSENRRLGLELLGNIRDVTAPVPQGGFYFYLDVSAKLDREYRGSPIATIDRLAEILLADARVSVVSGSAFGTPSGLRLSYACDPQELRDGLGRLATVLNAIE